MTTYRVCCFLRRFQAASDEPSEGIGEVFRAYAENGVLGGDRLQLFLQEVQGEGDRAQEVARSMIDYARQARLLKKGGLSLQAFFRWLSSNDNAALPLPCVAHQDMTAPLSHYFIYTSHNTYLTGNQLSSGSSDVPIVKALEKGVRVIELDIWPNATKDDVDVLHGRTLTSPVELIKCLQSIRDHAFVSSPFPVIITLEDHLTPDLQAKVAKMIKETFGDMLFIPKSGYLEEFPSPEELKNKIMISTKPPKEYLQTNNAAKDEAQKEPEEGVWGEEISEDKAPISAAVEIEHENSERNLDELEEGHDEIEQKSHLTDELEYKHLIAIHNQRRKKNLTDALKIDPDRVTRLTFGEKAYEKAILSHGTEIVKFTQRNILRIYPRGTRITSSNYNPMLGWGYGVQMVALNMQGHGRKLWLNHGMFRANGGCGYVKKPDILMNSDEIFNPESDLPVKKQLKVTVYMGDGWRFDFRKTHFDKFSPPDFYARVGIAGVAADTRMEETRVIMDNWTPMWDQEFVFPLSVPELALLRVEVHESDNHQKDDFGGQTCLPVSELRPGIRSVRLSDREGEFLPSVKLLMRFEFV